MSTRNLPLLVQRGLQIVDVHVWATVTQASPLRIKIDGEDDPLPFTPQKVIAAPSLADRVLVLIMANTSAINRSRRVVIVGKAQ